MIVTHTSCSWCHALNSTDDIDCRSCGHRAHLSRADCDCDRCMAWLRAFRAVFRPVETVNVNKELL